MSNYRRGSRTSSSILIAAALFSQHASAAIVPQSFRGLRSVAPAAELAAPITGLLTLRSVDDVHNQVRGWGDGLFVAARADVLEVGEVPEVTTTTAEVVLPTETDVVTATEPEV
ncbi:unnamed protein product, partial [Tilletia controversa]